MTENALSPGYNALGLTWSNTVFTLRNSVYQEGTKEMFYLTTHSTHFIYGYMASDI